MCRKRRLPGPVKIYAFAAIYKTDARCVAHCHKRFRVVLCDSVSRALEKITISTPRRAVIPSERIKQQPLICPVALPLQRLADNAPRASNDPSLSFRSFTMKARFALSSSLYALGLAFLLAQIALPQSHDTSPRRAGQPLAFNGSASRADNRTANESASASLDALVPRDGLQFYFEVRGGGLAQLAQSASALAPMMKMLARPLHTSANDFAAFAASQMGTLSRAKLAFVGYGADGTAALIEAANSTDAESLRAGVARLLGGRGNNATGEAGLVVRGRMVFAGEPAIVNKLAEMDGAYSLGNDQFFARARERFSSDPLFAYVELGAPQLPATADTNNAASMAGAFAGLAMRPSAVAIGGRLEGETLIVRAQMLMDQRRGAPSFFGLFSSLASATIAGETHAANFAATDTDVFIDFRLDWEKLLQSIETMFATLAGAQTNNGASPAEMPFADPMAKLEQSLGFSIRHDLLPTLGNEVAISLSSFDTFFAPQRLTPRIQKAPAARFMPPRFMLMVALKDATKFEQLMARLVTKSGAQPMARTAYHGAIISSNKNIAFAVTKDFFILGGSAADLRRALDAYVMGNSLAASNEFRAAMGGARETTMQLYLSSAVATKLFETLQTETAKASASVKELAQPPARVAGLGMSVLPDADGMLMEMRAPANLAFAAMAALATSKPANLTTAPVGYGIPASATAAPRTANGSRVPKMTDDDVVTRRP
jgi:hypothetical protein